MATVATLVKMRVTVTKKVMVIILSWLWWVEMMTLLNLAK